MDEERIQQMFKDRISDVRYILELHSEGKTSQEISTKTRTAESYVVQCLKTGYDEMVKEIATQYNLKVEDIPKEKSSLKKESVKEDKPPPSTNQELLCMDCTKVLTQIEDVVFNDFVFRMFKCLVCGKVYPHPLDSQNYLSKEVKT